MKFPAHIFRENDIRGIAGKDLSAELAYQIGLGYAAVLKRDIPKPGHSRTRHQVAVGRDCRLTSDDYAEALRNGLRDAGLDVMDLGTCPSPVTYFANFHFDLDGAIMVTGSHNPSDYNGFKISLGKNSLFGARITELRQFVENEVKGPVRGNETQVDIIPLYIDHLVKNAKPLKKMKIVIDAGNGTASTVAPELFSKLGAEVIPLYCELDGRFPNHHPDPTIPKNLQVMIETVKREKADMGFGFDGDSDRIGLVDEKGQIIFGDEMMILFARDVLKTHPGAPVISEVKSSYRLYDEIARLGGEPIMWKTGHALIKSKMKETHSPLAGEMSGHIFFGDRYFGYDDAIYAALRVYEIVSDSGKPLSEHLANLEKTINTPEIRIDCVEELKFKLVEETKALLRGQGKMNEIDGMRLDFGDGWGLVRASNTQPVIVLRFEATTEPRMLEIRKTVEGALKNAAKKLGHPPIEEESSH